VEILIAIVVVIVGLFLITLPVKLAASAMGAKRTSTFWCLIALIAASVMHAIGLTLPVVGTIIAFLLSSVAFAVILGTGILRGMGISVLHVIFSAILVVIVVAILGVSLAGLFNQLGILLPVLHLV
jgi:hypothetical protein